ncbi:LysM peptidoglycan-binding domain-containing protein [Accumulibacter sp.]|uniref:LysM peptidoglycan-binding domain-containing protein n=1 Tax=Accumulibacter sp. TaxID=2053492 RepID=UPI0025CD202E|nr:LysM peptidoglycan-binding domain-containing protein [Accumulibacter sp.]MCM8594819.1 LysM peptidoglycan-binding domain-containing protein [Accumulibacter sp.]MCM8627121.1 LysM peptidoglycan-binding domain-containing protein [Accumulibacter sp.]MDS4048964.1 LysM peptidoglycan-binding domain-containing protein [Accumulibacter sp.]
MPETIDLTSEPDELFQRVRLGFAMPNINNSLVLHYQQWYLNRPESLRRFVERSSRYLHHIVEELERRGMPMELALLPMVESAYNPVAYSRSHASGLWQFIPTTGKQYKLEQNWWVDERRDIVASTAAALDYLQYIYELHGDWHLALASYNWGEGAVGRAIAKNREKGLPSDYLSLNMPEETRHYVPKLQALKNIFSNPKILAQLNIRGVPNRPYFTRVKPAADIDVKLAARLAEMPVQEFVALNPAHNRPVIKSETPVVIPAHKVDTFISNLEAHQESDKPLSSWQAYTLRAGEKLEEVAPRFGMTVANLKAVNGINGRIRVSPGLTLLVAAQEGADPAELAALPDPKVGAEPKPAAEQRPSAETQRLAQPDSAPAVPARSYTVQKGDTLLRIAQRNGLSVAELKQINKLRSEKVAPGTRLALNAPAAPGKAQPIALAEIDRRVTETRSEAPAHAQTRRHTVRKGETLSQIASRYDMTIADLKQINRIRGEQVNSGSTLLVSAPEPTTKASVPTAQRAVVAEVDSRAAAGRNEATASLGSRSHTVRKGETLSQIASRYDISVAELRQLNRIRGEQVNSGTRLVVAAAEPVARQAAGRSRGEAAEAETRHGKDADSRQSRPDAKPGRKTGEVVDTPRQTAKKPVKLAQYTIRRGDTLGSIARQFKVEKDDLLRWNRIQGNELKPGHTLTIQLVQNSF